MTDISHESVWIWLQVCLRYKRLFHLICCSVADLKMCMTAGIGSDHVDLEAAMEKGITVTEVTFCNSISVAEHVVMQILALVRNYIPS